MSESDEAAAEQARLMSEKVSRSGWISIKEAAERLAPLLPASPISERHKAVVERRRASGEPQPTESEREDAAVKGDCETHMRLSAWRTDADDDSIWDGISKDVLQSDLVKQIIKLACDLGVPLIHPTLGIVDTKPDHESFIDEDDGYQRIKEALLSRAKEPVAPRTKAGKPGPKPELRREIAAKMLDDLKSRRRSQTELQADTLSALVAEYGGSPNTADAARTLAFTQFSEFQNSNSERL